MNTIHIKSLTLLASYSKPKVSYCPSWGHMTTYWPIIQYIYSVCVCVFREGILFKKIVFLQRRKYKYWLRKKKQREREKERSKERHSKCPHHLYDLHKQAFMSAKISETNLPQAGTMLGKGNSKEKSTNSVHKIIKLISKDNFTSYITIQERWAYCFVATLHLIHWSHLIYEWSCKIFGHFGWLTTTTLKKGKFMATVDIPKNMPKQQTLGYQS